MAKKAKKAKSRSAAQTAVKKIGGGIKLLLGTELSLDCGLRLVVIARDLAPGVVEKLFQAVTGAVETMAPAETL